MLFEAPGFAANASPHPVRVLAGALYGEYLWKREWSLAVRVEGAISANSNAPAGDEYGNPLGTGPGSRLTTWTLTPGWNRQHLFIRGEVAWVWLDRFRPGLGFGRLGTSRHQGRSAVELGVAF